MLNSALNIVKNFNFKFHCPVCNKKVRDFTPLPDFYSKKLKEYGYPHSFDDAETLNYKSYSCPHCLASDRDRLIALFIKKYAQANRSHPYLSMLEIAPSKPLSRLIRNQEGVSLRTADLMMDGVDDHINIMDMNCYDDCSFDCFICSHVLEHVSSDLKALSELKRILKPDGCGILLVPIILSINEIDEDPNENTIGERWRRFGQDDHVRLYSKKGFIERLQQVGFKVQQLGKSYFGEEQFLKCGISFSSVLYIVTK